MNCPECGYQLDEYQLEGRPYKGAARNRLPTRILDVLETDGGWMRAATIADRLGSNPLSVRRACHRLRGRGLVLSRTIPNARAREQEWRFKW